MPDGDRVQSTLPPPFRKPFDALCNGDVTVDDILPLFQDAFYRYLKQCGNAPFAALIHECPILESLATAGLFRTNHDMEIAQAACDRIARTGGNQLAVRCATDSFAAAVAYFTPGNFATVPEIRRALWGGYVDRMLDAALFDRVDRAILEHPNADVDRVSRDLQALRSRMVTESGYIAAQLERKMDVSKIRRRPTPRNGAISADYKI